MILLHVLQQWHQHEGQIADGRKFHRRCRTLQIGDIPESDSVELVRSLRRGGILQLEQRGLDLADPFQSLKREQPQDLFVELVFNRIHGMFSLSRS